MEYRIAGENDIDDIISLWDESRIYHEELDSRLSMVDDAPSRVRDYYHEHMGSENAVYFLAVRGEDTIGYICAQLQKTPPVFKHSHIGFIDGLFVKRDYRRLGVATKLVDLAVEWFEGKEIDRIQLSVAALNQTGIDFWKKYGFKELMHRMNMLI